MTESLDAVFSALADPTRRTILARLARGEATVGEVSEPLDITAPSVTKHLKVLERARLIERRVEGRTHHLRLDATGFRVGARYLGLYQPVWRVPRSRLKDRVTELVRRRDA